MIFQCDRSVKVVARSNMCN